MDQLILGPIDKYDKHNKFPWKFLIHILMLVLTAIEVACIVSSDIEFSTALQSQIYQQFLTDDPAS